MKTFLARTAAEWRTWLSKHHASESEVWLVFYKKHTGKVAVAYKDALDEALCHGWVDSLVKRIDDARYALKFTPRRADSRWSATNRKRYAELNAAGRVRSGGAKRAPTTLGYESRERYKMPRVLPKYIEAALRGAPAARRTFLALAAEHQRRYVGWIETAKREATKERRLKEAIRLLSAGKPLGLK